MSFLVWPPEVNSSLIFDGAGSGPMLAAAASWDGLAAELNTAAQSFTSITSGLADQAWQGPAAAAMMQTATRYASFLNEATAQAQTASAQAQAVVSAFESAQAATVHPFAVAANHNSFMQLVMSNLFGQNAPAIAAMESDYEQMWAQDVAAMVGYHGGASAAAAGLPSWTTALQGLSGQLSGALTANPAASALTSLDSAASSGPLANVQQNIINAINAPTEFLFGTQLISTGPTPALGGNGTTGNVPISLYANTEALVNASVGTGSAVPLLVDTGSQGLVIPFQKVGGIVGLLQLGLPVSGGISGYSGGLDYAYLTYNAPVNFGGGLTTGATPVDVELFAWPTSLSSALNGGWSFQNFFASDGASGVLGIGPNATGPGPSIPTEHFVNSAFNQGVLINETPTGQYLQFGAPPSGATALTTLSGAPITNDLTVEVTPPGGSTTIYSNVPSIVDTGGVNGTIPSSVNASPGDTIAVYGPNHQELYYYVYNSTYFPTAVSSGELMNTGAAPFINFPAYISNDANTMTFYSSL
ncbi:PecA family PE domain-processing aspartic protease [Mycobacterium bohemicum]|uniref:PecA family PE domain-processing aspartic protease n=1 Tax=Mycobacterium bohemicum TaxID=56425 RepID=UPI000A156505|nr:PecA family PE domain-processing aspartic protease [Mycobacterium bohemicum]